jgi:valyl-tRNA synthetase
MGQLVDVEKEIARISKELEAAKKFLSSLEGKLSNEKFVARAPEAVVAAEREKAAKTADLISQLTESLNAMQKL